MGNFLSNAMERGHLTAETVARGTGIPAEQLQGILGNETPLDRKSAKKLEKVFPKLGTVLLRMQAERQFFEDYGTVRPSSLKERASLKRSVREKLTVA